MADKIGRFLDLAALRCDTSNNRRSRGTIRRTSPTMVQPDLLAGPELDLLVSRLSPRVTPCPPADTPPHPAADGPQTIHRQLGGKQQRLEQPDHGPRAKDPRVRGARPTDRPLPPPARPLARTPRVCARIPLVHRRVSRYRRPPLNCWTRCTRARGIASPSATLARSCR